MTIINTATIADSSDFITLSTTSITYRYHAVWLRDNALDSGTRSPDNGQRLITLLDQPAEPLLTAAQLEQNTLTVHFAGDDTPYAYPLDWLLAQAYDVADNHQRTAGWLADAVQPWGADKQSTLPRADYTALLADDTVRHDWLSAVNRYGFALVDGLPDDPDALFAVIERFGFVRETNYGRYFDVRAEVNPSNLAFTGLGLQAHTDNPYRDPVPTLQILSCLENTADGGESILVDGFHAAQVLQKEAPQHFDLLSQYCANFRYHGDEQTDLHSTRPMIELAPDGELIAVRFNNRSAAPFTRIPFEVMADYYAAYRHFAEIIERPSGEIHFKLDAGQLFIVDNTRIMHSRKGFSAGGQRWLRGCYADKDGLRSTLSVLASRRLA